MLELPTPTTGAVVPSGIAWQWQLTEEVDLGFPVDLYDVDLFDLTADVERTLHADGRTVICYFSAGSIEDWRPDVEGIPAEAIGRRLAGWPDERWLDLMHPEVWALAISRLDRAVEKGCDGVEPDNVMLHVERTGLPVDADEQLLFNARLANAAHERGLSIALKNDLDQIDVLEPYFDFAVNESCQRYDECGAMDPFVEAGKAVLHVEYVDAWRDAAERIEEVCPAPDGFSTLVKLRDVGPERASCPTERRARGSGSARLPPTP